ISAWMEAVAIAGFTEAEADKLFSKPDQSLIRGLSIHLRPPVAVRNDYTARHHALLAEIG
ncbi:MAG: hypothetical protein V2I53_03220, partial [Paracoccaceae bacterium]|nr:hypothetical protein [Paracoccaceae bacterium]